MLSNEPTARNPRPCSIWSRYSAYQLTFEDLKFCKDRHILVVFDPASSLILVPQGSEGFSIQINFCKTKKEISSSNK